MPSKYFILFLKASGCASRGDLSMTLPGKEVHAATERKLRDTGGLDTVRFTENGKRFIKISWEA